jgi:hypothetical protein
MCDKCTHFALATLADRLREVPVRPLPEQPWHGKVLALLDFVLEEAMREGETPAEFAASTNQMIARLESEETEIVHRLFDMISEQARFLKATASMLHAQIYARARAGDKMAQMAIGRAIEVEVRVVPPEEPEPPKPKPRPGRWN